MTRRAPRIFLALALVASVLAAAATPPRAEAARDMELALQDDAVLLQRVYYDRDTALRQIRALGVTRLRVNLLWKRVLPEWQLHERKQPPVLIYDWSAYDDLIGAAAAHGMRVQLTISGPAPAWATRNHREGVYRPRADKFATFVRTAAAHFRGRVDRYSIWNEPNHPAWLQPHSTAPSQYRALFASGYRAVKSVDPGAQVLFGETSPYGDGNAWAPIAFLRRAACVDDRWKRHCPSGLVADGYAHHPYEFLHRPSYRYPGRDNATMGTLGNLTRALDRLAHAGALRSPRGHGLGLYLTEYGYFGTGRRRIPASLRAAYLREAYRMARRNPRVHQLLQYQLVSPPRRYTTFDTALIGRNGRLTGPYQALRRVAR